MEQSQNEVDTRARSIAYCGLICDLCYRQEACDGCRATDARPERQCPEVNCFQKTCCLSKGYDGCWECGNLTACAEGIYSLGNMSKIKAFAICIKEDGKRRFMEYVMENNKKGWSVEKGKDYDGKPIEVVLKMLRGN